MAAAVIAADLERDAHAAVQLALEITGPQASSRVVRGAPLPSFLHELERTDATLAVVGTHGHGRLTEILIGGVAGGLLHDAPCSVLIARRPGSGPWLPRVIVAGTDGSAESDLALIAARRLAERFDASLAVVTALEGKAVNLERARLSAPTEVAAAPVRALLDAAAEADLLAVGSRGLHGIRALGSVSERVAHQAACSVLVVRGGSG
jgi:nucleotide-binding universal stress UspA family protein